MGLLGIHVATYTQIRETPGGQKSTITPQSFNAAINLNSERFKIFAQQKIVPVLSRPDLRAAWLAHISNTEQAVEGWSSGGPPCGSQDTETQEFTSIQTGVQTSTQPETDVPQGRWYPEVLVSNL